MITSIDITNSDSSIVVFKIKDVQTKQPVPYVNVLVVGIQKLYISDLDGYIRIAIPSGNFKFLFTCGSNLAYKTSSLFFETGTVTEIIINLGTISVE